MLILLQAKTSAGWEIGVGAVLVLGVAIALLMWIISLEQGEPTDEGDEPPEPQPEPETPEPVARTVQH